MSKRIDRRTFVRSALTAGAGVLLAPSAGVERRAEGAAGHRGRLRPGRRLGRARHQRDHAVDAPGGRDRLGQRRLRGRARRGLREGRRERHGGGRRRGRLHGAPARERRLPRARRAVLLPLQDRGGLVARRALSHRPAGRLERDGPDRLLLLPGVHRGLLRRPPRPRRAGRRPRRLPRRLHLRAGLRLDGLDQCARPHRRLGRRRRGADARRVPAQVLALPHRREPARGPPPLRARRRVGRPRGRGQLRRRPARRRGQEPPRALRRAPRQRLPRVVRAHAAPARGPAEDLRLAAAGQRRAVPARLAPVPRRPAVQPDGRRAVRSRARRRRPTTRRARCSAPSRRRG